MSSIDVTRLDELIHRRVGEVARGYDKRIKALESRIAQLEQQREPLIDRVRRVVGAQLASINNWRRRLA